MHCREAAELIRTNEGDLQNFLMTDTGIAVEAHVSGCRCEVCERSDERIRTAAVRLGLRAVPGGEVDPNG